MLIALSSFFFPIMANLMLCQTSNFEFNGLQELQSASGEELSALMPSILDKAFKGEL